MAAFSYLFSSSRSMKSSSDFGGGRMSFWRLSRISESTGRHPSVSAEAPRGGASFENCGCGANRRMRYDWIYTIQRKTGCGIHATSRRKIFCSE